MNSYSHYNPDTHIQNLINDDYYRNLILLRNCLQSSCDSYFQKQHAPKVDLFLISKGVSSPLGKGSDSKPIPLKFGTKDAFLVDSAQFGMEPLVQKNFKMVYCYMPSFRGENPDNRHLNQFVHCEAELRGTYLETIEIVNGLIKKIIKDVLAENSRGTFSFKRNNFKALKKLVTSKFPVVIFDEAEKILKKHGFDHLIKKGLFGRTISRDGELKLVELVSKNKLPVWITKFDRDSVAFYQKPDPQDQERVLNADLLIPSLDGCFGGEIVGLGQRQNDPTEMLESMTRQEIKDLKSYQWYIDLRKRGDYQITSGFGLGIERLIAWLLCLSSIADASLYPVLKNGKVGY